MTSTLSFMTKKARQKTGDNFSQFVSSQVQIVIGALMGINHAHQTMASCEQHSLIFAQGVGAHSAATSIDRNFVDEDGEVARRMASFMARHRRSDGRYADLECGHA
jgi:hypothetical protein